MTGDVPTIAIDVRAEEDIAAPVGLVYDLVSDLTRMGEWSPENLGSVWVAGEPAMVGSKFVGRNRNGDVEWESGGIIISASHGHEFAWVMGDDLSAPRGTWRYEFTPTPSGTHVVESYVLGPGSSGFRERIGSLRGEALQAAVSGREAQLRDAMQTTLSRLKAHAESVCASGPPGS